MRQPTQKPKEMPLSAAALLDLSLTPGCYSAEWWFIAFVFSLWNTRNVWIANMIIETDASYRMWAARDAGMQGYAFVVSSLIFGMATIPFLPVAATLVTSLLLLWQWTKLVDHFSGRLLAVA